MARYILIAAVVGQPDNGVYTKYNRGHAIADSAANAEAGDLVWPALCAQPSPTSMRPLDAAGSVVMGLPVITLADLAVASYGGAAGEGVGGV